MKRFLSNPPVAGSSLVASAVFLSVVIYSGGILLHAQDATPTPPAPGAGQAKAKGKGKGRAAVDTLGEGPWDLKTETGNVHVSVVTKGLDHPWGLAFVPGGDMLVTERGGRLRVVRKGVLDPMPLGPLPEIRAAASAACWTSRCIPTSRRIAWIYFTYVKPGARGPRARHHSRRPSALGWRTHAD